MTGFLSIGVVLGVVLIGGGVLMGAAAAMSDAPSDDDPSGCLPIGIGAALLVASIIGLLL